MVVKPEVWIIYRDVEGFARKSFERMAPPAPGTLVVRDQIFPGGYGFPAMYIKKHRVQVEGQPVVVVTYTETAVTPAEVDDLARRGLDATKAAPPDRL